MKEGCIYFSSKVGTESIALWKDVPRVAMVMASAKPIMLWSGNVGAIQAGLGPDVTWRLSRTVPIGRTTTKVRT